MPPLANIGNTGDKWKPRRRQPAYITCRKASPEGIRFFLGQTRLLPVRGGRLAFDDVYNGYIGQNTSRLDGSTVFFWLDSVLDFRLAEGSSLNHIAVFQPLLMTA
jgi:hypothetical protein